jgi:nucleoside-diphosphate-sugar epimerase
MAILITGGTGFLGTALTELLIEKCSADIVLFDLYPVARAVVAEHSNRVKVVRGDFSEPSEITAAITNNDITDIFHLGYFTTDSEAFPVAATRINCVGTAALFSIAITTGVRRVVWASSAAVYGTGTSSSDPEFVTEDAPTRPNTFYGACKLYNEHVAEVYASQRGFDHVGLRLCAVFGAGRSSRRGVRRDFYGSLVDNPADGLELVAPQKEDVFTFAYVKDVASAFYASYAADRPPRRLYNVAGDPVTSERAVELSRERFPHARFTFAESSARHLAYVDGAALRNDLGFERQYDLAGAIEDYTSALSRGAVR